MKKKSWILLLLILAIPITFYFYFLKTGAPILEGKIDFSVEYKEGLSLDIYEPTNEVHNKRPVLIYYHGGAWVSGNKITVNNDRFHGTFNQLRDAGYAIISPDYTLAEFKVSPFPNCIADAFDVITWIENNAEEYNFDINNIGVLGESAGGHLALMVAYANAEIFTKPHNVKLNYVIGIYPPTDLNQLYLELKDIRRTVEESTSSMPKSLQEYFDINQYLFGFDSEVDSLKAKQLSYKYSPINYLNVNSISTLLIHGDSDRVVPISQSNSLAQQIKSIGLKVELQILEGVDHAFLNATSQQKEQTQEWIIDFVTRQLKE